MITTQCMEHQLWSADPIKAMKAFYDCQTRQVCNQRENFENNCIDHRHWATDLNDVREALIEYNEKEKISKTVYATFKKHMHKSLYADFEKSIERLKKCLENYICDTQLNQLLQSNSCGLSCYANNKEAYEYDNTFEEFSVSLLNDQCNVIYVLVNCLKMYIDDNEIFKLLDAKSLDQDKSSNYLKYIYTTLKKVLSIVFSSCKKTVEDKPIDFSPPTNYNLGEDLTVIKHKNRLICESQTEDCNSEDLAVNTSKCKTVPIYKSQTTDYISVADLTIRKHEDPPTCKSQIADHNFSKDLSADKNETRPTSEPEISDVKCCEEYIKLRDELVEMEIIKKQLLCEKRLKDVAGYKLLLAIRKASLNIKRENILSYLYI